MNFRDYRCDTMQEFLDDVGIDYTINDEGDIIILDDRILGEFEN